MIIPVACVVVCLLPLLFGGRLGPLADVRLRNLPLVLIALLTQVVIIEVVSGPVWLLRTTHVATYLAAGWFMWSNRRIPGAWVMAAGAAANGLTIAANGGTMPAAARALEIAGLRSTPEEFSNSALREHARLAFLGDVFPIPQAWPLSNVFSVGDVLVVAGLAYAVFRMCGTRWTHPWRDPDVDRAVDGDLSGPVAASGQGGSRRGDTGGNWPSSPGVTEAGPDG